MIAQKQVHLTPHKLCNLLGQKNKALMGRIVCILDQTIIMDILLEVEVAHRNGAMSNKGGLFIKAIKEYLKANEPEKLKSISKKTKNRFPQMVCRTEEQQKRDYLFQSKNIIEE